MKGKGGEERGGGEEGRWRSERWFQKKNEIYKNVKMFKKYIIERKQDTRYKIVTYKNRNKYQHSRLCDKYEQ